MSPRHSSDVDTTLCTCGHPRHKHEHLNEYYPAICSHVAPQSVDQEPGDPYELVCWCLNFYAEDE